MYRYYLANRSGAAADQWYEVTAEEFVAAERRNGFRPTVPAPDGRATGGFSGHSDRGKLRYEPDGG